MSTIERTPLRAAVGACRIQASIEKSPGGDEAAAAKSSDADGGTSTKVVLPSKRNAPFTQPATAVSAPVAVPVLSKAQMSSMDGAGASSGHQATRSAGGCTQPAVGVGVGITTSS